MTQPTFQQQPAIVPPDPIPTAQPGLGSDPATSTFLMVIFAIWLLRQQSKDK